MTQLSDTSLLLYVR